jgi:hypothetical protein
MKVQQSGGRRFSPCCQSVRPQPGCRDETALGFTSSLSSPQRWFFSRKQRPNRTSSDEAIEDFNSVRAVCRAVTSWLLCLDQLEVAHLSASKSVGLGGMERSDASELRMYNSTWVSPQVMYHSVSGNQPLIDAHWCIHSIGGFECWEPLLRGFSALQTIIPIDLTSQVYIYIINTELNCSQESKRVLKKKCGYQLVTP